VKRNGERIFFAVKPATLTSEESLKEFHTGGIVREQQDKGHRNRILSKPSDFCTSPNDNIQQNTTAHLRIIIDRLKFD
jgi:hypothetical protein